MENRRPFVRRQRPSYPCGQRDDSRVLEEGQTQVEQDEEVEEHLWEPMVVEQVQSENTRGCWIHTKDPFHMEDMLNHFRCSNMSQPVGDTITLQPASLSVKYKMTKNLD